MSKKPRFTTAGVTTDGKPVWSGRDVFFNHDTCGFSVADFLCIAGDGAVVDWVGFYDAAHEHGWQQGTILARLRENIVDSVGKQLAEAVCDRLAQIYPI